jgi:eukaryotic-like serine/threonine-protein kinase
MLSIMNARLAAALADRYRLERELGAGGMATVYLAQDLRHDRKVAIKVLKPDLAAVLGAERFLTEIRTTAALQHPHILALFDSGEADGFLFYVMPFIDGETLRAKLDRERQLGIDESVRITREVADALDYAHRHGVIHRDIKPENILLHDGRPVVADFGIALAVSAAAGGRMTETGLSLGTPHYMSPEQATAEREISARSDIYSLGCVLYEMLTGNPPHTGATAQQIIMKIVTEEAVPVTRLRRSVPAHVAAAVATALEKLPADRFTSARAFAEALANPAYRRPADTAAAAAAMTAGRAWDPRTWPVPARVAVLAAAALGALGMWVPATRPGTAPVELAPVMAVEVADSMGWGTSFAVSVTGAVAWLTWNEGIRVRPAGALESRILEGPVLAARYADIYIDFSPDGESLVYTDGPVVRRIPVTGGTPAVIAEGIIARGVLWGEDDHVYLPVSASAAAPATYVLRVPASGGAVDTLLTADGFGTVATLLPGLRTLLVAMDGDVVAVDLESRDTLTVLSNATNPQWSPTGHLVAFRDGNIIALPFDPVRVRALGAALTIADSVSGFAGPDNAFRLSRAGTLVYLRGADPAARWRIALVAPSGDVEQLPLPATEGFGQLSPDGRRLAYIRARHQVWVFDLEVGTHRQLASGTASTLSPVWSPDGTRIAFSADRPGYPRAHIFAQDVNGDTAVTHLGGASGTTSRPDQWLADGTLLFTTGSPSDIYRLQADSSTTPIPVLNADWREEFPRVSPDGRWIAYWSTEGGSGRTHVRRWPDLSLRTTLPGRSITGAPVWAPDGRTLYVYQYEEGTTPDDRFVVAYDLEARDDGMRVVGRRTVVVGRAFITSVHPDGRVLAFLSEDGATMVTRRLIAVANWHEVLRQRMSR